MNRAAAMEALVTVDLGALEHNLRLVSARAACARLVAVVKADAYGHGAVPVGQRLERLGVDFFAVARLAELRVLRAARLSSRILVLDGLPAEVLPEVRALRATPLLSSLEQVAAWCAASRGLGGEALPVHLKVDTGLSRLGLDPAEVAPALAALGSTPGLWCEGLASHLSEPENSSSAATGEQQRRFEELCRAAEAMLPVGAQPLLRHLHNSAAVLHRELPRFELARVGGALYGLDLAPAPAPGLRPVMQVTAPVVQVRRIAPGTGVGYGGRFVAARPTTVAVAPIGYADGYPAHVDGARALVHGHRVPLIGAVSMDRVTLDATGLTVAPGDQVVVLGSQQGSEITARDLAAQTGGALYEVTCRFGARLERRYLE